MQKNSHLVLELLSTLWVSTCTWQGHGKYHTNQPKHNNNNVKRLRMVVQEKRQRLASNCLKCERSYNTRKTMSKDKQRERNSKPRKAMQKKWQHENNGNVRRSTTWGAIERGVDVWRTIMYKNSARRIALQKQQQ
jgi:hypothetical protein